MGLSGAALRHRKKFTVGAECAKVPSSKSLRILSMLEYRCQSPLNLYKTPALDSLVTQAEVGRHLRLTAPHQVEAGAIAVCLCEDDYPGWLATTDLAHLTKAPTPYQPPQWSTAEIQARLAGAIAFTRAALAQPNEYLWGGTVAPNYDCSGLMQAAFAAVGIRLPRDAYQQEAFLAPIPLTDLQPGDLVFFGPPAKATHVGLYLGDDQYIHSSGRDHGRNGIGLDRLSGGTHPVSQWYHTQLRGAGRVVASYQPGQRPWAAAIAR